MEIRSREAELDELREQEQKISALMGRPANKATRSDGSRRRTDWRDVLAKVPKQFKASDVRKVRGLRRQVALTRSSQRSLVGSLQRW
jgi:Spy/CpxP family protein refolding chaperone